VLERQAEPKAGQRGMGKGLSAILPRSGREETGLRDVPLELIEPNPRQPRREFDDEALVALSESIRSRGVLQPVVVRPLPGGTFELIAGERRLRASKLAELRSIPAVIRHTEDWERLDLALAENMARVDLNPVEEARACAMLVEDLGLSKAEVGRRVGKSRVAVSNLVRLLELPDEVLDLIESGSLSEAHGRAILTCKDHEDRKRLARDAREHGWSVRETERRARELEAGEPPRRPAPAVHPDLAEALAAVGDAMSDALGRSVRVRTKGDGCRLEIDFDTPDEARELAERLAEQSRRAAIRAA
jgi:ParB family transcriptional regulator, chromosome partitioning protein